jgi:hypothetical protein
MKRRGTDRISLARSRLPVPVLVALAVLLVLGPVGLLLGGGEEPRPRPATRLSQIAGDAGCRLTEFGNDMHTNPPVTGQFVERIRTGDGSYAGQPPPSLAATTHALFHGRVLFQYRRGLRDQELQALDRLLRKDPDKVLLFENQTGMSVPVAATAYLSVLTCPRVDRRTLRALDAFRARRRAFGQGF